MKKILLLSLTVGFVLIGCTSKEAVKNNVITQTVTPTITQTTTQMPTESPKVSPKPNTSAAVDTIIKTAREDSSTVTEQQLNDALNFIKNNYTNYFKDNDTMEKSMYYGALFEYHYKNIDKVKSDLGMDLVQAVKYVYRGNEKVNDPSTQSNLEQIKKSLDKIK